MTDKVAITAGSGTDIATDDRGAIGHVQRVVDQGATSIAIINDASVTTSAENIAARDTRKRIVLFADESNTDKILLGTSGGQTLPLKAGASWTLYTTAAVYYKSASGTQILHGVEEYD
jgi:hypothetical protein